jgi:hypothetical protein
MADKYFTQLTQLTAANIAAGDAWVVEDITAGETKYVTSSDAATYFLSAIGNDGWSADANTWTYASASTFTVTGNVTTTFQKGVKLKFTQTTVKYAVVLSSSYSAPDTTVTIFTNTDYVIAAAAITNNYWSRIEHPQSFPHWFNYAVTPAGITISNGTQVAQYAVCPDRIRINYSFTLGSSSAISSDMQVALPVTTNLEGTCFSAYLKDATGLYYAGFGLIFANVAYVRSQKVDATYSIIATLSSTVPFTWTTSDIIAFSFEYSW